MGALLGVGQGSAHDSRVVVMRWNGGKKGDAPVAFIGKGVCFDTGGISIKPAAGMEDMKGDMAGAACVTGLMHALAARKAKVNAVGVIGLVENMPDGKAQRPGDIVTSMSGQTIEIINTDAEGRLVLADVIWYAQQRFKPKFMVDLATLTGAIIVALGHEYAGMFANNDELAERLTKAGEATGELVWRMPLAQGLRQADQFQIRRHEEHRRPHGRRHHRRAVHQALRRRQDAVGASRHRRHRLRLAPERHQQELGLGLGRAAAGPAGGGLLREVMQASGGPMTEILFYHLQGQPLESVLPALLEKSLERGWRVVVQGASEERIEALDAHLWTYRDDGFLPHGTWREAEAAAAAGAAHAHRGQSQRRHRALPDRRRGRAGRCRKPMQRIVLLFDGEDEEAVAAARALERGQGQGLRGHLLAAGRAGPLGEEGVTARHSPRPRRPLGHWPSSQWPTSAPPVTLCDARACPSPW